MFQFQNKYVFYSHEDRLKWDKLLYNAKEENMNNDCLPKK
jgi:hypothetical protein